MSNPISHRFAHGARNAGKPGRVALLALALALLASAAGASPAAAIVPLGQFGEGAGDQAGLLDQPTGVAVDATGRVYVAERARVSVFSPEGEFLRAFGKDVVPGNDETGFEQCTTSCKEGEQGEEAGDLSFPRGIAVDGDGLVYVAEGFNNRISVFSQQGDFLRAFGGDVVPGTGESKLSARRDPSAPLSRRGGVIGGQPLGEVCTEATGCQAGREGDRAEQLNDPQGLAIDGDGVLYVADVLNNRVALYSRDGEFLRAFGKDVVPANDETGFEQCTTSCKRGEIGEGAGEFNTIHNLAVDAAGDVYISEVFNLRVSVFSPEPELEFQHAFGEDVVPSDSQTGFEVCTEATGCKKGTGGSGLGALLGPEGVAVDADGQTYISEFAGGRVSVFSPEPAFVSAFGKDVVPGNDVTGFEECSASCQAGAGGGGPGELSRPEEISLDCRGALFVVDAINESVQRFGEPGTGSPACAGPGARKPFGIKKVRRNTRKGTAKLILTVPWSAEVRLRGAGIKPAAKQVEFAGKPRLAVRPDRETMRRLNRRGEARVQARVTYRPWGGKPQVKTRVVGLRKRQRR